jgi:hypothetical protein
VSRIRDIYPGSRIQKQQKRGAKICWLHFFVAINFTKIVIILFLNRTEKKFETTNKELNYFLPKKLLLTVALRKMGWGSGIQKKTYSGSRGK